MEELIKYILDLDFLTTKEFCQQYKILLDVNTNKDAKTLAAEFLRLDAIKFKMIVEKTKEISKRKCKCGKNIGTLEVFEGVTYCDECI